MRVKKVASHKTFWSRVSDALAEKHVIALVCAAIVFLLVTATVGAAVYTISRADAPVAAKPTKTLEVEKLTPVAAELNPTQSTPGSTAQPSKQPAIPQPAMPAPAAQSPSQPVVQSDKSSASMQVLDTSKTPPSTQATASNSTQNGTSLNIKLNNSNNNHITIGVNIP